MSAQINDKVSGLLHKFRSGDITPAEFQDLRTRMDTISDVELKHLLETEWEEFEDHSPLSEEKMKTLYEGLHIRSEEVKPRFTLKRYWMQIAASLLLLIAGSLTVLTFMQRNEINALAEQNVVIRSGDYGKSLVTLPDGTIVHLNAKSSLTYSQDFGRNDRKVALSGEGFFEVKKDTEKKFTVGTGYMDITVLGTKFNVYAYETKDIVEMSLVEGSVDVTTSRPPYQSIRSERLEDVFRCLSRKFAVTFSVDDETLLNDVYTGTFDDENVESIMRVLKYHYKFKYTNEDGVISIQTRK